MDENTVTDMVSAEVISDENSVTHTREEMVSELGEEAVAKIEAEAETVEESLEGSDTTPDQVTEVTENDVVDDTPGEEVA